MLDIRESVATVYDWCADYLDAHGWVQGHAFGGSRTGRRPVCPVGAFVMANGCHKASIVAIARDLFRVEVGHIGHWNDVPGREQWEVTTLLRDMAKRARHGELELVAA